MKVVELEVKVVEQVKVVEIAKLLKAAKLVVLAKLMKAMKQVNLVPHPCEDKVGGGETSNSHFLKASTGVFT